jgi:hypothetical protein
MAGEGILALSVMQPWAWLVATGACDHLVKAWPPCSAAGTRFLVHAAQEARWDVYWEAHAWAERELGVVLEDLRAYRRGGVVGMATLAGAEDLSRRAGHRGPYRWALRGGCAAPWQAIRGWSGWWKVWEPDAAVRAAWDERGREIGQD